MFIGLDFDNTLAGYDRLFASLACERGWLPAGFSGSKKEVRDRVRLLDDGEIKWQQLQGLAYGPRMGEAALIDGVAEFLGQCRQAGHRVCIVSHKTEFSAYDESRTSLRQAALAWMERQAFFAADGFAIPRDMVFFGATRAEKIEHIRRLDLDLFIDDLVEVVEDPSFPPVTARWLFTTDDAQVAPDIQVFAQWDAMTRHLFGQAAA